MRLISNLSVSIFFAIQEDRKINIVMNFGFLLIPVLMWLLMFLCILVVQSVTSLISIRLVIRWFGVGAYRRVALCVGIKISFLLDHFSHAKNRSGLRLFEGMGGVGNIDVRQVCVCVCGYCVMNIFLFLNFVCFLLIDCMCMFS